MVADPVRLTSVQSYSDDVSEYDSDDASEAPSRSDFPVDVPEDLSAVSTRQLRVLANRLYRELDTDFPPYGAWEDYATVADELQRREESARRDLRRAPNTCFRDNPLRSRFELFRDGVVVASLAYTLRSGKLTLRNTVLSEDHLWQGLESELIRHVLLNAHRRRLAVVPYCLHTQSFLETNPHFRSLILDH